jgi:diguanylate cyclase (GGDEF)-like protein
LRLDFHTRIQVAENSTQKYREELSHQTTFDTVTGLPNRSMFIDRLEISLEKDARFDKQTALIFIDLDNFKIVNDSLGHSAGDELLVAVTSLLKICVGPGQMLARLGGDEFVILLEDVKGEDAAKRVADNVSTCLQCSIPIRGRDVYTTASIGVAINDGKCLDPGSLMRQADIAMYRAKADGRGSYFVFDSSMNEEAKERLELESELRTAINNGELRLHYQPIIDMKTGQVVQVEALVRWQHPIKGLLAPGKFIAFAEASGLIVPLGLWVLENACCEAGKWRIERPDTPPMVLCVNLSTLQFNQDNLVSEILRILQVSGLPPNLLKLEITESLMMDSTGAIDKLNEIRSLGVKIAIDDFGTGYSSMSYLGRFPIDSLKIDQSFISNLNKTSDAMAIVEAMIMLGKALGMRVTCEGIETEFQHKQLKELGCDFGQGYHYSRPVPLSDLCRVIDDISTRADIVGRYLRAA